MIQHNDSDTSCMRAVMPAERTIASEAEHTTPTAPQKAIWGLARSFINTNDSNHCGHKFFTDGTHTPQQHLLEPARVWPGLPSSAITATSVFDSVMLAMTLLLLKLSIHSDTTCREQLGPCQVRPSRYHCSPIVIPKAH